MTKTAEAGELARHLSEFLEEIKAGNEVLITSEQKPVARLIPLNVPPPKRPRSMVQIKSLPGKWIGETILSSGDLAEEMFVRK